MNLARMFAGMISVSRAASMLNEFVKKIHVHERDRKGSIETTQQVDIYFSFVGRYIPPQFVKVELNPEEQEEHRKREKRRLVNRRFLLEKFL